MSQGTLLMCSALVASCTGDGVAYAELANRPEDIRDASAAESSRAVNDQNLADSDASRPSALSPIPADTAPRDPGVAVPAATPPYPADSAVIAAPVSETVTTPPNSSATAAPLEPDPADAAPLPSGASTYALRDGGVPRPRAATLETVTLPGFPHAIDVYAVNAAERAIVMLHGGGGNKELSAHDLGLNATEGAPTYDGVDWAWLAEHSTLAVFPQGQALPEAPNAFTWNNHVMQSGQDDVAFLNSLSQYIRDQYHVTHIYLMGHSNGAMMANRMWCESPATFDAYIAIAGPASTYYLDAATPCEPTLNQPYFGIVGAEDPVLGVPGKWGDLTWEINPVLAAAGEDAFVNPLVIGEWLQERARGDQLCGEAPALLDAIVDGMTETWSACDSHVKLQRISGGEHAIDTLEAASGYRMLDVVTEFLDGL